MPKMKTNRGAAKRFTVTGRGKIRRRRAGMRHILTSKRRKRKRQLRRGTVAAGRDERALKRLLPHAF
jgi:large subunit ribosomal protein L35